MPLKARHIVLLGLIPLLALSCGKSEVERQLDRLDAVLAARPQTDAAFELQLDSMRRAIASAPSDSLRWEACHEYFDTVRYWSVDSATVYARKLSEMWVSEEQRLLSDIAGVRSYTYMVRIEDAYKLMNTIDTSAFTSVRLWEQYAAAGMNLYQHREFWSGNGQKDYYYEMYRLYIRKSPDNPLSKAFTGILLLREGEYEEAERLLKESYFDPALAPNEAPKVAVRLVNLSRALGRKDDITYWLAETAIADQMIHCRMERSLRTLSFDMLERKEYERASLYTDVLMRDAIASNSFVRLTLAGNAMMAVSAVVSDFERRNAHTFTVATISISILSVIILFLLLTYMRQAVMLRQKNRSMEILNQSLKDANSIKENYVARYMILCSHYIDQVDNHSHELRMAAKQGGYDAVMALLRLPSYSDSEQKNFYRVFDATFLGLYPNFVEEVNALMPEDMKFEMTADNSMSTNLRILAAIRLGIDSSAEIAKVLHCAPRSVYTYRSKTRKRALCPADEFEERIKMIGL